MDEKKEANHHFPDKTGLKVTFMLSYLMFQVNGKVRFKWLVSHFVGKTTIKQNLIKYFQLKYSINTKLAMNTREQGISDVNCTT